jgi:UDP-N-acetylmuramoyl-tripeptide--D-alanyl-D-alanine ligase
VKEYVSHILSRKYKVLKTEKNTNTEIGIAQTILQKLTPEHEVFVCEMGAYSKGEIKLCAQIAVPKIGVFSGLNNQHAALFGSLDDTFKSKWELIQSLPGDGLAVVNGDSEELRKRVIPSSARMVVCSTSHGNAVAENVRVTPDTVEFSYQGQPFRASLTGSFQVVNLLISIVLSEYLGMKLPEISEQVSTLKPPEKTMVPTTFSRGVVIDDSYNVNSDGLKQSLLHLDQFEGYKKVILFPGILELGQESAEEHERFGELIGHHVDYAFFTDPSFSEELSRGALEGGLTRRDIFEIQDQKEILKSVQELLSRHPREKFVFLFESRGAEKVLEWLKAGDRELTRD